MASTDPKILRAALGEHAHNEHTLLPEKLHCRGATEVDLHGLCWSVLPLVPAPALPPAPAKNARKEKKAEHQAEVARLTKAHHDARRAVQKTIKAAAKAQDFGVAPRRAASQA